LADLHAQGLVKTIGIGANETEPCRRLATNCDPDIFLLAGRYTLLEQSGLGDLIPLARKKRFSILPGGPYADR
jgi:D-threo-aldose 1-dehydrogenase